MAAIDDHPLTHRGWLVASQWGSVVVVLWVEVVTGGTRPEPGPVRGHLGPVPATFTVWAGTRAGSLPSSGVPVSPLLRLPDVADLGTEWSEGLLVETECIELGGERIGGVVCGV